MIACLRRSCAYPESIMTMTMNDDDDDDNDEWNSFPNAAK
jgi:hypothetical protein